MKIPHLARVEEPAAAFAPLAEALAAAGLRLGWLEWRRPEPLPPSLLEAAGLGTLRAVAVGGGVTTAVKPIAGRPVLRDLLREHFLGCALVLVHLDGQGSEEEEPAEAADLPLLARAGEGSYRLTGAAGERRYVPAALAARLRSPRPLAAEGESAAPASTPSTDRGDPDAAR